jgi:hypothetical protein
MVLVIFAYITYHKNANSHYSRSGCFINGYFYFNSGMRVIRPRIGG